MTGPCSTTNCRLGAHSGTSNSGRREEVGVSRVAYPPDIRIFIENCAAVPEGRPNAATLVAVPSGKIIASGLSCSGTEAAEGYPSRLELPPLNTLSGQDRSRVRGVTAKGQKMGPAELRLFLRREWRSVLIDGIMSI